MIDNCESHEELLIPLREQASYACEGEPRRTVYSSHCDF